MSFADLACIAAVAECHLAELVGGERPAGWTPPLDVATVTREYPSPFSRPIRLTSVATVASLEQFRSKRSA